MSKSSAPANEQSSNEKHFVDIDVDALSEDDRKYEEQIRRYTSGSCDTCQTILFHNLIKQYLKIFNSVLRFK